MNPCHKITKEAIEKSDKFDHCLRIALADNDIKQELLDLICEKTKDFDGLFKGCIA